MEYLFSVRSSMDEQGPSKPSYAGSIPAGRVAVNSITNSTYKRRNYKIMTILYGEKKYYRKALKEMGVLHHPHLKNSLKLHKDWELRNIYEQKVIETEGSLDMAKEKIKAENLNQYGSIFGQR